MKKFISILLTVLTLTSFLTAFQVGAETLTKGDWEYTVLSDGTVSVCGYYGTKTTVTIPATINGKKVTEIDELYTKNYDINTINIPAEITKITEGAFRVLGSLKNINVDENNTKYSSVNGVLYSKGKWTLCAYPIGKTDESFKIPSTVKYIDKHAFYGANLNEVIIPEGVKEIREAAFKYAELNGVTIPSSVETIGTDAFNCNSLICGVVLSNGIKRIESRAFYACNFQSLSIPASVEYIAEDAFSTLRNLHEVKVDATNSNYCSSGGNLYTKDKKVLLFYPTGKSATTVTVTSPVERIGDEAFSYDKNLQDVVLGKSVKEIGDGAFSCCINLKKITLTDNVKKIGTRAFYETGITEFSIPSGLTEISDWSFCATALKSITIPENIKTIGDAAFINCESMNKVTISSGVESIGESAFRSCGFNTVKIPNTVKQIGMFAFAYCENLINVTLPEGITCIPSYCFCRTAIKEIKIPESVTKIEHSAFEDCKDFLDIVIPPTVETIEDGAFGYVHFFASTKIPGVKIYGLTGTTAQYYAEENDIKFVCTGNVPCDVNSDGQVSVSDATAIQKYLASISGLNDFEKAAADADGNGKVTISDATELQKMIVYG